MNDPAREWIAQVCREYRERHGFRRSDVASDVGREGDSIRNFETLRGMWNPQTGAIVESYANRSGVTSLELWSEATRRWAAATTAQDQSPSTASTPVPGRSPDMERRVDIARTKLAQVRSESRKPPARSSEGQTNSLDKSTPKKRSARRAQP